MKNGHKIFEYKMDKVRVEKTKCYKNHKKIPVDATFSNNIFPPTNSQTRRTLKI
jgi:hypothetical protein